jgi:hypothetical protein
MKVSLWRSSSILLAIFALSAHADDFHPSAFTGVKVPKSKVVRFKGKTVAEIVATLEAEEIEFVYLSDLPKDPRNARWTSEELAEFREYRRLISQGLKKTSDEVHRQLNDPNPQPEEGLLRAFSLFPNHHYPIQKGESVRWKPLPHPSKPKIVLILNRGELPDTDTVLHEYIHHLFDAVAPGPTTESNGEKFNEIDVASIWYEHANRELQRAAKSSNDGKFKNEDERIQAFAKASKAFLVRSRWELQVEYMNYMHEAEVFDFQLAVHRELGLDEEMAASYLYGIYQHAMMLRTVEERFRTNPNLLSMRQLQDKIGEDIIAPLEDVIKVDTQVRNAWTTFQNYYRRPEMMPLDKILREREAKRIRTKK